MGRCGQPLNPTLSVAPTPRRGLASSRQSPFTCRRPARSVTERMGLRLSADCADARSPEPLYVLVSLVSPASTFLLPRPARRRRSRRGSPPASPSANRAANLTRSCDTSRLGSRIGSRRKGPPASHLPRRPALRGANRPQNRRENSSSNPRESPSGNHPGNRPGNGSQGDSRNVNLDDVDRT